MNPAFYLAIATLFLRYVGRERALGHRPLRDFLEGKQHDPEPNAPSFDAIHEECQADAHNIVSGLSDADRNLAEQFAGPVFQLKE